MHKLGVITIQRVRKKHRLAQMIFGAVGLMTLCQDPVVAEVASLLSPSLNIKVVVDGVDNNKGSDGIYGTEVFEGDPYDTFAGVQEYRIIPDGDEIGGADYTFVTAYFGAYTDKDYKQYTKEYYLYASRDEELMNTGSDAACYGPFHDSGFFELAETCTGKAIALRRSLNAGYTTASAYFPLKFVEIRLYMMPNLLQVQKGIATIERTFGNPTSPKWGNLPNLITNLDSRSNTRSAGYIYTPPGFATYNSCFEIDNGVVDTGDMLIRFTIDLKKPFFIHAVLLVEDEETSDPPFSPHGYVIGNDPDPQNNAWCNNSEGSKEHRTQDKDTGDFFGGLETFCNMEGQYVTIVAGLQTASLTPPRAAEICSLGIMGTEYARSTAIEASYEVTAGELLTITVEHIKSYLRIGYEPVITVTSSPALAWISLIASADNVELRIQPDSNEAILGSYTLTLESKDTNNWFNKASTPPTLKTDTINLTVNAATPKYRLEATWTADRPVGTIDPSNDFDYQIIEGSRRPTTCTVDDQSPSLAPHFSQTFNQDLTQSTFSFSYTPQSNVYDLVGTTTFFTVTCKDRPELLSWTSNIFYNWKEDRPTLTPAPPTSLTFRVGVKQEVDWGTLEWNPYDPTDSGTVARTVVPDNGLAQYITQGPGQTSTWDDGGLGSSLVGTEYRWDAVYTNGSGRTRTYTVTVNVKDQEPPVIKDYDQDAVFEIVVDQGVTYDTDDITEGSTPGIVAEYLMSPDLVGYIQGSLQLQVPTYFVRYEYTANSAASAFIKRTDLEVTTVLWDGEKKTKSEYTTKVTFNQSIAPKFETELPETYTVEAGTAETVTLPNQVADPYAMRTLDPITVIIGIKLQPFLSFDPSKAAFIWTDDAGASGLASQSGLLVSITLWNERDDSATFTVQVTVTNSNSPPTFTEFDSNQVHEVEPGETLEIKLPEVQDPDEGDEVTIQVFASKVWITYEPASQTVTASPPKVTTAGLERVLVQLEDSAGAQTRYWLLIQVTTGQDEPAGEEPKGESGWQNPESNTGFENDKTNPGFENDDSNTEFEDDKSGVAWEENQTDQDQENPKDELFEEPTDNKDDQEEFYDETGSDQGKEFGEEPGAYEDDGVADGPKGEQGGEPQDTGPPYEQETREREEPDKEEEKEEEYFGDDEGPGEPPSTQTTDFDATTLWAVEERKKSLQKKREQAQLQWPEEEIKEPKITERSVNAVGQIVLRFDQNMLFEEIFGGLKLTAGTEAPTGDVQSRRLQQDEVDLSGFIYASVQRGSAFSAPYSELQFKLSITEYDSKSLKLKAVFEQPLSVSTGSKPDKLKVYFPDPELFVGSQSGLALDAGDEDMISMELPRQFPDTDTLARMEEAGETVQLVSKAAMGANIVLTVILSVSLKAMWNMVHVLQVIVFLPELLEYPPNAQLFVNSVQEAVELEQFTNYVMELVLPDSMKYLIKDEDELSEEQKELKDNIFISLGLFAIVLVVLLIIVLIYILCSPMKARCHRCCRALSEKIKKQLFFGAFIRYMIESSLKLAQTNFVFLAASASLAPGEDQTATIVRIVFAVVLATWILFAMIYPLVRRSKLQDEATREKFGAMYDGIKTESALPAVYTAVFCLRRLLMVLAFVRLKDEPVTMLYVFLGIFTLNFTYLTNARANTEVVANWLEYFNELCLVGVLYSMLFFVKTNMLEALVVWDAGIGTISMLGICFVVNFSYMVVTSIKKSCHQAKLQMQRKKNLREYRLSKLKPKRKVVIQKKKSKSKDKIVLNNWQIVNHFQQPSKENARVGLDINRPVQDMPEQKEGEQPQIVEEDFRIPIRPCQAQTQPPELNPRQVAAISAPNRHTENRPLPQEERIDHSERSSLRFIMESEPGQEGNDGTTIASELIKVEECTESDESNSGDFDNNSDDEYVIRVRFSDTATFN